MKAKLVRGAGFRGVLSYVFGTEKNAEIIGGTMSNATPRGMAREFGSIRSRKDCKNPVWHASLSLPSGEHLASEKWDEITTEFLQGLDLDPQKHLYTVVRHQDTDHDHVHIIACRVGIDGKIWHGQKDVFRAIKLTASLEKKHGLAITPTLDADNPVATEKPLSGPEIQMGARQGEAPPRLVLQAAIKEAIKDRPTASVFAQRLINAGIGVRPALGKAGTLSGFSFEYQGVAFKGSQLGKDFGWAGLQKSGVTYDQDRDLAPLSQVLAASRGADRSQTKKEDRRPEANTGNASPKNQEKQMGVVKMDTKNDLEIREAERVSKISGDLGQVNGVDDDDGEDVEYLAYLDRQWEAVKKRWAVGDDGSRRNLSAEQKFREDARRLSGARSLQEKLRVAKEIASRNFQKYYEYERHEKAAFQAQLIADEEVAEIEAEIAVQRQRAATIGVINGVGEIDDADDIGYDDVGLGPLGMSIEDAESLAREEEQSQALDRLHKQAATAAERLPAAQTAAEIGDEIRRLWTRDGKQMMDDLAAKGLISDVYWRDDEAYARGPDGQRVKFSAGATSTDSPVSLAVAALMAEHGIKLGWRRTWCRGSTPENTYRMAAALEARGQPYRMQGARPPIPPHYLDEARRHLAAANANAAATTNAISIAPAPAPKVADPAPVAPPSAPPISKFVAPPKPTVAEIDSGRAAIAKIGIDSATVAAAERSGVINFSDGAPKMIGRDPTGRVASAVEIVDKSGWRPKAHSDNAAAPVIAGDPRTVWVCTTPSEALAASALAVETGQSRPTVIMAGPAASGQDWLTDDIQKILAKADRVIVATTYSGHGDKQDKVEAASETRREAIKTALADTDKPSQVLVYSPKADSVLSDYKVALAAGQSPTMTTGVRR